jgi:hypothetical protein
MIWDQFTDRIAGIRHMLGPVDDARIFAHQFTEHSHPVLEELAAFGARVHVVADDGLVVGV